MANFVQLYKSTDTNAPVLTGQTGSLITLLNKCLVDGYTTASVTSITKFGDIGVALLGSANSTLVTGNYLTFSGCTGGDASTYNATYYIFVPTAWQTTVAYAKGALVTNVGNMYVCRNAGTSGSGPTGTGTSITDGDCVWDYVGSGAAANISMVLSATPAGNATGTLLYAKAGLQWTKPFAAGTNSQTYRSADNTSNQFYLQVIDNAATAGGAKEAQIYGAEVMSADQTVTSGRFPTSVQLANGMAVSKSNTADATARTWTLFGDDRTFYLFINTGQSAPYRGMAFGHFISFKAGDAYNTFISGDAFNAASASSVGFFSNMALGGTAPSNLYVARSYTQLGGAIAAAQTAIAANSGTPSVAGGSALLSYPNPADSGLYVMPTFLTDSATTALRGRLPGLYMPLHNAPLTQYDIATNIVGLSGVTLTAMSVGYSSLGGQLMMDAFGPWS